jgi:hypothetical protein
MNRYQKFCLKKRRDEAHAARLVVDNLQYEYQNFLAEAKYVRREVQLCRKFRSLDEDMRLVSVETFFENASKELIKPVRN